MSEISDVRPSPIAGHWYPGEPESLKKTIDKYLKMVSLDNDFDDVVALIAPHAGYRYSGPVAAHAFAALKGMTVDLVAVISPMHHPYPQPLLTTAHDAYETPLGLVPIDREAVLSLDENLHEILGFGLHAVRSDPEHSLEIELPFLQRVLPDSFTLLPVMVRDQSKQIAKALGSALAPVLEGKNSLLVASTDLSHFYPKQVANILDGEMLDQFTDFNPDGIFKAEREGTGFACGHAAVAAVLWASRALGANSVEIVNYATSGEITGDHTQVVGYGAGVISRK